MPHPNLASAAHPTTQPVRLRLLISPEPPPPATPAASRRAERPISARWLARADRLDAAVQRWLVAHSIALLRISLGAVFLAFGVLKLSPGVSPAESLVKATMHVLTFGVVPGGVALAAVGTLECVTGLWLLSGRALRGAVYLLGTMLVGILSPLVLLAPRLFAGPHHAPTLEGQYVLKDLVLVAATLVLAATLRGGGLAERQLPPRPGPAPAPEAFAAHRRAATAS